MITVSIVTFYQERIENIIKKLQILENCIKHLSKNKYIVEIGIFDNSKKDTLKYLKEYSPKIKYFHMEGNNLGYGRAHNLSRKYLKKSEYHLIVNPDIIFKEDNTISKLKSIMDSRKDIALIQPLIKDPITKGIQKLCKRNPTLFIQFIRAFLGKYINKFSVLKRYNSWYEMENLAYKSREVETEFLSGCFMFIRRNNLDKVDWFSDDFFLYLEDADLTRKLSKTGKCIHYPLLGIYHVWERGSYKKLNLRITAIKSFFIYSRKWGLKVL